MPRVVYREIPDLPGFRFGSDGTAWNRCGRGPRSTAREWRQLKPSQRPNGFQWFYTGPRESTKPVRLDEMVCRAFHGDRPQGTDCLHRDRNRRNCRSSNLSWGAADGQLQNPEIEYRTVPEYPGYRFGADGSVWSQWGAGFAKKPSPTWRKLRCGRLTSGHYQVSLRWKGKQRRFGVHHLLCLIFYGRRPKKHEARHIDGDPANNRITNLRWGIRKDNAQDQLRHGTLAVGERSGKNKLKESHVREIRRRFSSVGSVNSLAKEFGVSWPTIARIIKRKSWRHVL
jgi:hypothetical protein